MVPQIQPQVVIEPLQEAVANQVDANQEDGDQAPVKREAASSRKRLPQEAVNILNNFFAINKNPSVEERTDLANRTGLAYSQINNWFGNKKTRLAKAK